MKIIFLNAWEGKVDEIKKFILDESITTDIFCFQESYNAESKIFCQDYLPNYQLFFGQKFITDKDKFYQATFVKKGIEVVDAQIIGQNDNTVGLGLFTKIKNGDSFINLCNTHGTAWPGDKQDTPARIKQSQLIIDFFKDLTGPKIIGGDFNLDLNIQSVQMFESNELRNLIKEFKIPTTRNRLSWERFDNKQLFADHLFVSKNIIPKNFSVPNIEISDHQPLVLEFEI